MRRDTILIVDDMEINRTILSGLFKDEYHLLEAENGAQALFLLEQYHSSIAIMLLDVVMPEKDGYQVLEEMGGKGLLSKVPVVVITADDSLEGELRAFDLGASDIIVKPFEPHVVKRRVHNIIELYLHRHNLEDLVDEQAMKLRETNNVLIDALSSVIEYRSLESGQHIRRIRMLTKALLEEVKQNCPEYSLDEHQINAIASASAMHDIGKIAIPDNILNKPGKLTKDEFEIMKTHSLKGCEILASLERMDDKEYLSYAYNICRHHHERWDGKGYPDGLAGETIPICAQVTGIADAYDALTSDRVYKKAIPYEKAANMILNGECGSFSPKLLTCFKNVQAQMASLVQRYADGNTSLQEELLTQEQTAVLRDENMSSFQKEQMKYHAMLRYENAIAAEVDFTANSWYLVYSSDRDMLSQLKGDSLDTIALKYAEEIVHPDDRASVTAIWNAELSRFFEEGCFRKSWKHRVRYRQMNSWQWIQMTVLRVDMEHLQQKKALLLWKPISESVTESKQDKNAISSDEDRMILHSILKGIRQLRNDKWYTIVHMEEGLLGYSSEDIQNKFNNQYIKMIHPDDRNMVKKQLDQQLSRGNSYELEYRVINSKGQEVWLLSKGHLLTNRDGEEILYGVLIDIERSKKAEEQLQMSLERYKIILEQTNDIIFEWDIPTDHVEYSANWKEKFGYDPISENVSKRIPKVSHLHPDDMKRFGTFISEMKSGKRYGELEFRVSNARGCYQWSKVRATLQFDNSGKPYKAVGLIIDINDEKVATQILQAKAERDMLTNLYNKESARQRIEQRLEQLAPDDSCVLFVMDLDNFKMVNDRYGHMFGDAVLKKISQLLMELFHNEDILARIGGDEFMAMFHGALSRAHIESVAARIIERLQQSFEELPAECRISCSIGISIAPENGSDFKSLFQKADIALYRAKSAGKKQFCIYDASVDGITFRNYGKRIETANTEIDSDNRYNQTLSDLIPGAFYLLSEANNIDEAIAQILGNIGRRLQISRAYVFENSDDGLCYSNSFEWCNDGITPHKHILQDREYAELDGDYSKYFNDQGILYCSDLSQFPPKIRELLQRRGVKSMLQCAIRDNGVFKGWVGFDDSKEQRLWTKDQIEVITFVSELLSMFLLKERVQRRVLGLSKDLKTVLDHQDSWIYVIDAENYKILYINEKMSMLAPDAKPGAFCYEVFMKKQLRCEKCPAKRTLNNDGDSIEVYNEKLKLWTRVHASLIDWGDRKAYMIVCHDITTYRKKN